MDMNPITIDNKLKLPIIHIEGILVLQELYLVDNLSPQENKGFVTTRFSVATSYY
jgi:hypothetical protein